MDLDELLKESMEKLENLQPTVLKHSNSIRELDEKVDLILKDIRIKTSLHVRMLKKWKKETKINSYYEIDSLYKEAEKLTQKKIKLASAMYDAVDADIAVVDRANQALHSSNKRAAEAELLSGDEAGASDSRRKKKKDKKTTTNRPVSSPAPEQMYSLPSVPVVEMPVDPNEPTYCVCHQVSFGEMIMCDNKECKTEWFHFQCVGLTESPPGKWYCETCAPLMKKKKK